MKLFRILRNALRYNKNQLMTIAKATADVVDKSLLRGIDDGSCYALKYELLMLNVRYETADDIVEWYRRATGAKRCTFGFTHADSAIWFTNNEKCAALRETYRREALMKFHLEVVRTLRIRRLFSKPLA